ncbi:MAG: leucyl/phenylalanyl-tRNA--protein transferase [Cyclobacteriaceae bacterium]|nr:leucyl/phenylalanyl-tRNA--protein transferase [Cyclobacteriaceae bacterium]
MPIYQLTDQIAFPPIEGAEEGIVAVGGDLSTERLELAYQSGIFPWFSECDPIVWWSPDPRYVLYPEKLKVSKSMKQVLRKNDFRVTFNKDFEQVIDNCRKIVREGQNDTWITTGMKKAYIELHKKGLAISVEVWQNNELVGGLYGIDMGNVFCGESMFAKVSNASKVGFITFVKAFQKKGGEIIDCQVYTSHLASLGAEEIDREAFMTYLEK